MNEKNEQKSKKANRYTEEFKKQIVALHDNGKPSKEINRSSTLFWTEKNRTVI